MNEVISWFEIPAVDFERAVHFYSNILGSHLRTGDFMGIPHGFFEGKNGQSGGAIIHSKELKPSTTGPLIYLFVENMEDVLARVAGAGGSVIVPKMLIGPQGVIAVIGDTEGNHVGLHAN